MRKKEYTLFETYGGRLTEEESVWLVRSGIWMYGMAAVAGLSLPLALVAPDIGGLVGAILVMPLVAAFYIPVGLMSLRNLRRVTSSLAQRHGLDPKAARKIEFRKGLERFDETLAEAQRRSAPESR